MTQEATVAYKQKLLEVLHSFDTFCKDNGIKYYAVGGTLLGAVRHHGFIPWDDDLDVCMPFADYKRFVSLKSQLAKFSNYRIVSAEDKGYYLGFAKYYDANTTLQEIDRFHYIIGVYIDVFPMIETSFSYPKIQHELRYCNKLWHNFKRCNNHWKKEDFAECIKTHHYGIFMQRIFDIIWYTPIRPILRKKIVKEESRISGNGEYCCAPWGAYGEQEIYRTEWFKGLCHLPFEDMIIPAPKCYHEYLSHSYGNYMLLPPEDKRTRWHGHYYINLRERLSFSEVKKRTAKGEHEIL